MPLYHHKIVPSTTEDASTLSQEFAPAVETSGFDELGHPIEYDSAIDADCGLSLYKRKLAYLENTGTQHINSGVLVDNDMGVWLSGHIFSSGVDYNSTLYGGSGQWGVDNISAPLPNEQPQLWCLFGNITRNYSNTISFNSDFETELNFYNSRNMLANGSTITSLDSDNFPNGYIPEYYYYIFANSVIIRFYRIKLTKGETLVRDFIPVMDNHNVPCLLDQVTNKLFYNEGTGTFNYGELS